jgi:hypothetical protein
MPSFGGLEDDEGRGLGGAQLIQQLVVHHHLRHAAIGQASDKSGAADVLMVEFQGKPRGQEHAERVTTRIKPPKRCCIEPRMMLVFSS